MIRFSNSTRFGSRAPLQNFGRVSAGSVPNHARVRQTAKRAENLALKCRARSFRQLVGQQMIASLVKKKSAIRIVIDTTTTVRVVLFPTPAVPPRVVIPK